MEYSLMGESIKFMVIGMIVVFLFLAVLVQLMKFQAKIITKYFPDKEVVPVAAKAAAKPVVSTTDDAAKTAAIIAAITEFNKNKS